MRPVILSLLLVAVATAAVAAPLDVETVTLSNGLTVILHPDHTQPMVTINTWFHVGSKDEAPGRSGFAHLFEHLMFMGTDRVPGNQFDVMMESGGGAQQRLDQHRPHQLLQLGAKLPVADLNVAGRRPPRRAGQSHDHREARPPA